MKNTSCSRLLGRVIDQGQTAHAVLGVERGASCLEVRAAYLGLVKQFHPDKNSGDPAAERRFKRLTQAYEELKADHSRGHRGPGAFPRRRQHRRVIEIVTAAAFFAVPPALVLTFTQAAWKPVPVLAAQSRIEPARMTPLPALVAPQYWR